MGTAMGEVHRLLREKGREAALRSDIDRRVVEAAAAYLASEEVEIGFLYSGWAQADQTPTFKVRSVDLTSQVDKNSVDQTNPAAKPEPDNAQDQQPDEKKAFDKLLQDIQASAATMRVPRPRPRPAPQSSSRHAVPGASRVPTA